MTVLRAQKELDEKLGITEYLFFLKRSNLTISIHFFQIWAVKLITKKITSENQSLIFNHNIGFWKSMILFCNNWSDTWCGIHSTLLTWSKNIIFNVFWDVGVDFWDFQNFHIWNFWIFEISDMNESTLIDYTRELRAQMSWKSPDSCVSDNLDVV